VKVVVFGATGGTGRAAVELAAARGDQVTVFARRPERLRAGRDVRVVEGDAFDPAAVARAIEGQDAVVSALGVRPWRHRDVCSEGVRHILDGMRAHGVGRLVVVSAIGVGDSREGLGALARGLVLPLLRRGLADKARMEEIVRASDVAWTIVRPSLLTHGAPRGRWRVARGAIPGGFITRSDLAAFCLVQLGTDEYLHQLPTVG
jgi:putative NADH-flavin reductase